MSRMPQPTETERLVALAQSLVAQARQGQASFREALKTLTPHPRISALADAALAAPAPAWLAPAQLAAAPSTPKEAADPLQFNDTKRARKHRFMV